MQAIRDWNAEHRAFTEFIEHGGAVKARLALTLMLAGSAALSCREDRPAEPPAPAGTQLSEQLRSLGYIDFTRVVERDAGKSGVTWHDLERSHPGYNLYNTRTDNRARLVSMDGDIVHEWYNPDLEGTWHHIEMTPTGDLLVLVKGGYAARLLWDSSVSWKALMNAHHDVSISEDGSLFVLDREIASISLGPVGVPIVNDAIALLSAGGDVLQRTFLYDLLKDRLSRRRLVGILLSRWFKRDEGNLERYDVFHTNTIELVDRDLGGFPTRGGFLICVRELDLVAILDPNVEEIVWSWGPGELDRPHQPSLTRRGHVLIFDNGFSRGFSRVVEVNPATGEIVWEYGAEPVDPFFSAWRGGAQELANGNVLITESDAGRAFEVTRDGEIVWEFFNPDLVEQADGDIRRGAIYRMTRIEAAIVETLLESPGSSRAGRSAHPASGS